MAIKLFTNDSQSLENYLNRKAKKGYVLKTITPFVLFPPLVFTVFDFEKKQDSTCIYRVDSRKVKKEDLVDYNQLFLDDGWHRFPSVSIQERLHIFYSNDPEKISIYSDDTSIKERNQKDALYLLGKSSLLVVFFVVLTVFFPIPYTAHTGFIGFVLHYFYILAAVLLIGYALVRYVKNKGN